MRFFVAVRFATAAALLLAGTLGDATARGRPGAAARPVVALHLAIDSGHYRNALDDRDCLTACKALVDGLVDTVRALLQHTYPFLRWSNGANEPDTVDILVANGHPSELLRSDLRFIVHGRSARVPKDTVVMRFERDSVFSARDPEDWSADSLRRHWLGRFPGLLGDPNLLPTVFGRIPIVATVTPSTTLHFKVNVSAADLIGTQEKRPVFVVVARVVDPATGANEEADLLLKDCKTTTGNMAFSCVLKRLKFPGATIEPESLPAYILRASVTPSRVFLKALINAQTTGSNTLLMPGNP